MRMHTKKLCGVCAAAITIWLLVSYSSVIDVPRLVPTQNPNHLTDLESKIDNLSKKLQNQVHDTVKLLEIVNELKKEEQDDDTINNLKSQGGKISVIPVLVIACNRITVKRCLDNLIQYRPDKDIFPIIVSQDCGHEPTYQVIKKYVDNDDSITVVRQPDLSDIPLPSKEVKFKGYFKIARHYKFALNHVFNELGYDAVIIIEDDLDISPDIFEYFLGTYPLLLKDPSLWCISAWNDNGKRELIDVERSDLLYRTDFFPGLGWLLRKESWHRLEPKWPSAYFDDWLRNPQNVDSRACVRPEISRTYSFGKIGISKGMYFDKHLRHMFLNKEFVSFTKLDLSYLIQERYDHNFTATVYSLPHMTPEEILTTPVTKQTASVMVPYSNAKSFQIAAKKLGLMDDFRSGVPRTGYRGIVSCFVKGRRVHLAPDFEWIKYDASWG